MDDITRKIDIAKGFHKHIQHHNAIFLSDIHLGFRDCKADFLLDFLTHNRCKTLYLVGDVIDMIAMRRNFIWPESHHRVLREIIRIAEQGTRVIYVPGNHDHPVRELVERNILGVEIMQEAEHMTADGRNFLVLHGDCFDEEVLCSKWKRLVGVAAYWLLLQINRWSTRARRRLGLPYWSMAYYIKNNVRNAREAIQNYEKAAAEAAQKQGYDGIICGHIHQPELRKIGDVIYCNDGDWIESCTALTEDRNGWLEIVHWGDIRQSLKACRDAHEPVALASLPRLDVAS